VIRRAVEDWSYFAAKRGPIETAINLPIAFLQDPRSINRLCELIPDGQAFDGLIAEINATEIVRNLKLAKELASEFRKHKIAISIDNLGAEWLQLVGISNFPFVELKVDRKFIFGCADDPLKQSICRRIVELADGYGARTVAEGVQTWSGFPHGSRHGLRSGARVAVRQADERREVRADLLGRAASRSLSSTVKVHGTARVRQPRTIAA
jgi:EAL domain-containing protein (putative c-di-GMP-specific phosphodiesterase class I)